eukprot:scaffold43554_cov45-Attheya_sp.AAC.3
MPTRVTFRVKRGLSLPVHERTKKQRMTNIPEEVTVKTEEIDDGRTACDHGAIESALCEPSYDPHLSHSASPSSTTSKQLTSQVGTSDNAEMFAFEGSLKGDLVDSLSSQGNKSPPIKNGFSELQSEEELEYEEVAQNSTAHKQAAIPFILNNKKKRDHPSWDERFKELVDFKAINGHTNFVKSSGPLGTWVDTQRQAFRQLKEGKYTPLTSDKCKKLESIEFEFRRRSTEALWYQRFQELVDFKKIHGHMNVLKRSGQLGTWVDYQRQEFRRLKEGKDSPLTSHRCEKMESIGFTFICRPSPTITHWDQRFRELVDFKAINGHANVATRAGPLGRWVKTQRKAFRRLKEGKDSPLTNEKCEKLESIGFVFVCPPSGPPWDERFKELVDFKAINGHTNVPDASGPLGTWVHTQRQAFRRLKEGRSLPLTIERWKKLESIGFEFRFNEFRVNVRKTALEICKNLQR